MNLIEKILKSFEDANFLKIQNFGYFKLEKPLGKGKQGTVFLATNKIDKQFAIKFFLPNHDDSTESQKKINEFLREVEFLSKIHHKNIINIYSGGFATYDDSLQKWEIYEGFKSSEKGNNSYIYFYVMDFHSSSLANVIENFQKEPIKSTDIILLFERLISEICDALTCCHNAGIAHKDIKAENILFQSADSNFVLADFGKARNTDSHSDNKIKDVKHNNPFLEWNNVVNLIWFHFQQFFLIS